ncbi:MAG: hypothetical protein OHK0046_18010 [Anaerolineae bacterium]
MKIKFGAYDIIEEIGKGGMATVYRAYHRNMDRDVAIKVIKSSIMDDTNAIERFQQEAKVIARLEHPHILPVYDFDGTNDPPYIVMRYLDGGTLKDVMKQGLLPLPEVAHIIQQIASALDYAHRQGIVHRDIKPSNIMVDREGNVFVSDLGIARITGDIAGGRRGITASGAIVGTPEYMSPEQALGLADITYQADIYSLGVMLFETITGSLPFSEDSAMATILKHIQNPVPSVLERNADLPGELDEVLSMAMAKEPEARYASATELARHLVSITGLPESGPRALKKAAESSVTIRTLRPISIDPGHESSGLTTGSKETPGEQQRQITVVHVNLADFEEILLEISPEEANHHLTTLLNQLQPLVEQGGGVIREQTQSTLQALWGVFEVREDDPEIAIRTALQMRDAARAFTTRWLQEGEVSPVQIGIDTGLVVVRREGDGTLTSSGQPINYAARVERAAPPGSVMVTYDTFRHVIGVFSVSQETPVRVRGRSEPLEVYVVQEARPRAFRLQTRGVEGIETKMVGRDSELKLLQDAMLLCIEDAETQMVTVTAEAGVGKSRLLYEFTRWLDLIDEGIFFFEGRATQQTTNLPYALIRSILSFRFDILDSDTIPVMRQKLTEGIAKFITENSDEAAAFIGQLVGFDFSDHPAVQPILSNAEAFQRRAEEHLNTFFNSIAQEPAILQLEDIHWADHQSLDLINQLVTENQHLPLMIICMARPQLHERRPGWGEGQDFHHRIDLKPLSKLDSRRLLREVLQRVENIPTELRDLITDRADGNPFYVEELVKILIEDGVIVKQSNEEDAMWEVLTEKLDSLRVPPTLTGVLQARLDTLDPVARLLLGRASVIGRIFWTSAVDYLQKADGFHIHNAHQLLDDLREREMVFLREKSDFAGTEEYVIKHAILRDVIYESLLKRQQREYHKAAAEWLIEASAERADEYTGLIAEHYELAGEMVLAASYLLTAGKKARAISAVDEAITLLNHALSILTDNDDNTRQMWVYVQRELMYTSVFRRDFITAEQIADAVLPVARALKDDTSTAYILAMMGLGLRSRGRYEESANVLQQAEELLDHIEDRQILAYALRQVGNKYMSPPTKSAENALAYYERSLAIGRELNDLDIEASAYNAMASVFSSLNQPDEAISAYMRCIEISQQIGNESMHYLALGNLGIQYQLKEDFAQAHSLLQQALEIGRQLGVRDTLSQEFILLETEILMGAGREDVRQTLLTLMATALQDNRRNVLWFVIETFIILFTREGHYERIPELMGVWSASPFTDPDDPRDWQFVNPAMEVVRQHLSEEDIADGIEHGKTLDMVDVCEGLLTELKS